MNNITKLTISLLMAILIINAVFIPKSNAIKEVFDGGINFIKNGEEQDYIINQTKLKESSSYIYKMLLAVGIIAAVAIATTLGIKFMTASMDEKAKIKEAILPFIIGCIVIFGAFTIWKIVAKTGFNAEESLKEESQRIENES